MNLRPIWLSAAIIVFTMIAGLVVRFGHLGLPLWLVKYGGSGLWATMIYWLVSTLMPNWRILRVAVSSGIIATVVELLKLVHTPALETFRRTLAGTLLLGRIFSVKDIAAYWLAIAVAATIDLQLCRSRSQ